MDISGKWTGNSYFLGTQIFTEYELHQEGNNIIGFGTNKNGADSSKFRLVGEIKGQKIFLKGVEYVYKVGKGCLSKAEFTYSNSGPMATINGRWKGTMELTTCPPGVAGRVDLFRKKELMAAQPVAESGTSPQMLQSIHKDDFEGTELVNALADRKYYALIIAVEDYNSPDIQDLDNPAHDAISLSKTLNEHYTFEKENTLLLHNPNRSEIITAFDELASKVKERDNLLIFYAGHGIWDERLQQGFWLPSDATLDSKAQWLSNSTIRDYVGGIDSKHTLLITDACFSGSIFKERAVFNNSKAILEMYKLPSRRAMTSGALKTVPDKSVFIQYLNKNLARNTHPLLSAEQLFQSFKVAVINNSPNGQVPQYGPIGQVGDEGGDFIFLKRGSR